jgi:hypothetical protein
MPPGPVAGIADIIAGAPGIAGIIAGAPGIAGIEGIIALAC